METEERGRVLVTGGAGYVGAVLVPKLLSRGYAVRVLDLYLFGHHVLDSVRNHPGLEQVEGDIRDRDLVDRVVSDCDAVIHLACVSNDPSFELDPPLSRSINYEAFPPLVRASKAAGARRFIYASTSSVYGVSDAEKVTEDHPLVPITDYNRYKGLCEPMLLAEQTAEFVPIVIRPATVCGYSPRQRLDLTVNILTSHAVNLRRITVHGGDQVRPNIHIEDIVDLYVMLLEVAPDRVAGQTYNAGYQNYRVGELAEMVRQQVEKECPGGASISIVRTLSPDPRSYRICSDKIRRELGFEPERDIECAIRELVAAFGEGKLPNAMTDTRYYNVNRMQELRLS